MRVKSVSLDRLTVVGKMRRIKIEKKVDLIKGKKVEYFDSRVMKMLRCEVDWKGEKLDYARDSIWMKIKHGVDYDSRNPYDYWFRVGGHIFIQVISKDNKGNDFRVDWNPNKLESDEAWFLFEILRYVSQKKYTRVDLAIDVEENISKGWTVIDERRRKKRVYFAPFNYDLESVNLGTHYSLIEDRIYDKAKEQNRELNAKLRGLEEDLKQEIKDEFKASNWWRIEETIRGKVAENWEDHEWFKGLKLIKGYKRKTLDEIVFPEGMKPSMKAAVIACMTYPELLDEYSKNTRKKIEKLIDELTYVENFESEFVPSEWLESHSDEMDGIKDFLKKVIGDDQANKCWAKRSEEEEEKEWEKTKEMIEKMDKVLAKYRKPSEDGDPEG